MFLFLFDKAGFYNFLRYLCIITPFLIGLVSYVFFINGMENFNFPEDVTLNIMNNVCKVSKSSANEFKHVCTDIVNCSFINITMHQVITKNFGFIIKNFKDLHLKRELVLFSSPSFGIINPPYDFHIMLQYNDKKIDFPYSIYLAFMLKEVNHTKWYLEWYNKTPEAHFLSLKDQLILKEHKEVASLWICFFEKDNFKNYCSALNAFTWSICKQISDFKSFNPLTYERFFQLIILAKESSKHIVH